MENHSNIRIYRHWAPVYDALLGRFFAPGRRQSIGWLNAQPGERILLVGIGTGQDLAHLPPGLTLFGIDLSREMMGQIASRSKLTGREPALVQGDAGRLPFPDAEFDIVLLSLILSVVPHGSLCLQEALRVLRVGGRAVVYDKFLPPGRQASTIRRLANAVAKRLGTDINRHFEEMLPADGFFVPVREPATLGGLYQVIVLEKIPVYSMALPAGISQGARR